MNIKPMTIQKTDCGRGGVEARNGLCQRIFLIDVPVKDDPYDLPSTVFVGGSAFGWDRFNTLTRQVVYLENQPTEKPTAPIAKQNSAGVLGE